MLKQLMSYFGSRGQASRIRQHGNQKSLPAGNRGMPKELQRDTIIAAEAKRKRKMERASGWFDGDGA